MTFEWRVWRIYARSTGTCKRSY